jgi:hypothetical protein
MQTHNHPRRVQRKRPQAVVPSAPTATPFTDRQKPAAQMPEIHDDELLHLATDIAYFRAVSYREVQAEDIRADDIRSAEQEITALIRRETNQ